MGAFAIFTALLIHAGFSFSAYEVEAIFLAAVLALAMGGLCLESFICPLLVGRSKFARQTLPWAG